MEFNNRNPGAVNSDVFNGVSRDGPPSITISNHPSNTRNYNNTDSDDDLRIEFIDPQSPQLQDDVHHHALRNSRKRGLSETQNLLVDGDTASMKNSFEEEITRAFKYVSAPILDNDDREMRRDRMRRKHLEGEEDEDDVVVESGVPRLLIRSNREAWKGLMMDLFIFFASMPFLALGIMVIVYDGREVSEVSERSFRECCMVVATFFPITFAMVVGRAILKFASWKLERGSTIGVLEQLMASRTFSSSIITQLRIRKLPFLGCGLIFLWLFSPAGSQAVLRMQTTKMDTTSSPANVSYFNTRQQVSAEANSEAAISGFATLFGASLLASREVKLGPMDSWENVKIPCYSSLENVGMDRYGWKFITKETDTGFSSLFGIPISNLPTGNSTFTIESTHMELSCSSMTSNITRGANRKSSFMNPGLISPSGPFKSPQNITAETTWAIGYLGGDNTPLLPDSQAPCLDCLPQESLNNVNFTRILLFQDFTGTRNVTSIYCSPQQAYVESRVQCSKTPSQQTCTVTAQRASKLPHPPSGLTLLSFPAIANSLITFLQNSTPQSSSISMLQNYLTSPLDNAYIQTTPYAYLSSPPSTKESPLLNTTLPAFSLRLSHLLNSYLTFLQPGYNTALTSYTRLTPSSPATAQPLPASQSIYTYTTTHSSSSILVFKTSYPFFALYLFSTLLLPVLALLSTILKHLTISRDYLSFVSSLMRESGAVTGSSVGLDGIARARKWRDVRVRIGDLGDVEGGYQVGTGVRVGVGRLGVGRERRVGELDAGKLYL